MSRLARLLFVSAVASGLAGCAGYRLGPTTGREYRSVAVLMFRNKTYQPQLEAQITNAIIKRFQLDGALRVDPKAVADVVVTGEIVDYRRHELRSVRTQIGAPREYRISIDARIEARERATGKVVVASTVVTGNADTFIGDDLQNAELQVLPLVADDLAKQVVRLVAERW